MVEPVIQRLLIAERWHFLRGRSRLKETEIIPQ
jgi:hypothetical protein